MQKPLFPNVRTLPLWKRLLVRAFGERHEHLEFTPDGVAVVTAYRWRGQVYVTDREFLFKRGQRKGGCR